MSNKFAKLRIQEIEQKRNFPNDLTFETAAIDQSKQDSPMCECDYTYFNAMFGYLIFLLIDEARTL
uniref:Uncharacterized protein n=1 Tax=Romanomermis culicivorax TaxID=13658 RepID=A0A915IN35_ROMCU